MHGFVFQNIWKYGSVGPVGLFGKYDDGMEDSVGNRCSNQIGLFDFDSSFSAM